MTNFTASNSMCIPKHPGLGLGRPVSEIELTQRNDSASVHAGRSYALSPARQWSEASQQSEDAAGVALARQSPLAFRARSAAAAGLQKQRCTLEAKAKRLRQQIGALEKLDLPTSELWAQYTARYAAFKHSAGWGTACTLSIIGFLGGFAFLKGAYDEYRAMTTIKGVLQGGGAQAGLAKLRAALETTQEDLATVVRNLNRT